MPRVIGVEEAHNEAMQLIKKVSFVRYLPLLLCITVAEALLVVDSSGLLGLLVLLLDEILENALFRSYARACGRPPSGSVILRTLLCSLVSGFWYTLPLLVFLPTVFLIPFFVRRVLRFGMAQITVVTAGPASVSIGTATQLSRAALDGNYWNLFLVYLFVCVCEMIDEVLVVCLGGIHPVLGLILGVLGTFYVNAWAVGCIFAVHNHLFFGDTLTQPPQGLPPPTAPPYSATPPGYAYAPPHPFPPSLPDQQPRPPPSLLYATPPPLMARPTDDNCRIDLAWMRFVFPSQYDFPDAVLADWVQKLNAQYIFNVGTLKEQSCECMERWGIPGAIAVRIFNFCRRC